MGVFLHLLDGGLGHILLVVEFEPVEEFRVVHFLLHGGPAGILAQNGHNRRTHGVHMRRRLIISLQLCDLTLVELIETVLSLFENRLRFFHFSLSITGQSFDLNLFLLQLSGALVDFLLVLIGVDRVIFDLDHQVLAIFRLLGQFDLIDAQQFLQVFGSLGCVV